MNQAFYKSDNGDLASLFGQIGNADLIIMVSNGSMFERHVKALQTRFPNIPSIATTGHFYGNTLREGGVGIVTMRGVSAVTGVLRYVNSMPLHDIKNFERDLSKVGGSGVNTAVIDFCTGNDSMALSTLHTVLQKNNIQLTGGTAFEGKVAYNGNIFEDALCYAIVKNNGGKVKVYKENIYYPLDERRFIANKTDRNRYYIGELNGRSAKSVYLGEFGITERQIQDQTFKNPFGKFNGKDIYIISLKEASGEGLCCYRQVNDSDVLTLLCAGDHRQIVNETIQKIRSDFKNVQGIFSVNCIFRYMYFNNQKFTDEYLKMMSSLGSFCGFVGNGEHFNDQFINQSMSCVVFG